MSQYSVKYYMTYQIEARDEDEALAEAYSLMREEFVGLSDEDMSCLGHEIKIE